MSDRNPTGIETLFEHFLEHPPKYNVEAYLFVLDALHGSLNRLKLPRHLKAHELLEGIREMSLKSFGPMARTVMEHWGIYSCEDFGNIVFDLVHLGLISKKESDSITDFKEGFNFEEAFERPYQG